MLHSSLLQTLKEDLSPNPVNKRTTYRRYQRNNMAVKSGNNENCHNIAHCQLYHACYIGHLLVGTLQMLSWLNNIGTDMALYFVSTGTFADNI